MNVEEDIQSENSMNDGDYSNGKDNYDDVNLSIDKLQHQDNIIDNQLDISIQSDDECAIIENSLNISNIDEDISKLHHELPSFTDIGINSNHKDNIANEDNNIDNDIDFPTVNCLKIHLKHGTSIEQLLEHVSSYRFTVSDIIETLINIDEVKDEEGARTLCSLLFSNGFISILQPNGYDNKDVDEDNNFDGLNDKDVSIDRDIKVNNTIVKEELLCKAEGEFEDDEDDVSTGDTDSSISNYGNSNDDTIDNNVINNTLDKCDYNNDIDEDEDGCSGNRVDNTETYMIKENEITLNKPYNQAKISSTRARKVIKNLSAKITSKSFTLFPYLKNEEIVFSIPSLYPELTAAAAAAASELYSNINTTSTITSATTTTTNNNNSNEKMKKLSSFSIILGENKYNFKCASFDECMGWMQGCRQSVEFAWKNYFIDESCHKSDPITMDTFQTQVTLSIKVDGPTKVLSIVQDKDKKVENKSNESIKENTQKEKKSLNLPTVSDYFNNDSSDDEESADLEAIDSNHSKLNVSLKIESIALSLVDSEPSEVFYFCLKDIEMSIERTKYRVRFGCTVQDIQISNQLLSPAFPVSLFPRRANINLNNASNSMRLLIPGLHQRGNSFPTLHVFSQEKFHQNYNVSNSNKNDINLKYFDRFTFWIAPLQLDLDDESLIRVFRFFNEISKINIYLLYIFISNNLYLFITFRYSYKNS
jgi:hypothetical protein